MAASVTAVLWIEDSSGNRVDASIRAADGSYLPTVIKLGTGITASTVRNGPLAEVTLNAAAATGVTITGDGCITVAGTTLAPTLAIPSASGANRGTMSAANFAKLAAMGESVTGTASTGAGLIVEDVADNGSGACAVKVTGHPLTTGDRVVIANVGGVPGANGTRTITKTGANNFDLDGSTFSGAYTSGGIVYRTADILDVPAPDNAVTTFRVALKGTSGAGYTASTWEVKVAILAGAIDGVAVSQVGRAMDNLGVAHVPIVTLSNATGAIKAQTSLPHWGTAGSNPITVEGESATSGASGVWAFTNVDADHLTLTGSTYVDAGISDAVVTGLRDVIGGGAWASGVATLYVIGGSDTAGAISWSARAEGIL